MSMKNLIPYGLRNGHIISVEDLDTKTESGNRCNCICPSCKAPLLAKINGHVKRKHFAHDGTSNCVGAYESALHLLVKEVIEEGAKIMLPPIFSSFAQSGFFVLDDDILFNSLLSDSALIEPDVGKTEIEKDLGGIRPDVIIESSGYKLIIEVLVSHAVNEKKRKKIKELGISCIEVDFSCYRDMDIRIDKSCIRNALEGNDPNVMTSWIFSKKQELLDSVLKSNISRFWLLDFTKQLEFEKGTKISDLGFKREIINGRTTNGCPLKTNEKLSVQQIYSIGEILNNHLSQSKLEETTVMPSILAMQWNQVGLIECLHCEWNKGSLAKLNSPGNTEFIICGKRIRSIYAGSLVIDFAKNCTIPSSVERCAELIHAFVKTLDLVEDDKLINVVDEAIGIISDRYIKQADEEKKQIEKQRQEEQLREKALQEELQRDKQKRERIQRENKKRYEQQGQEWRQDMDKLDNECRIALRKVSFLKYKTLEECSDAAWKQSQTGISSYFINKYSAKYVRIAFNKVAKEMWQDRKKGMR